MFRNYTVNNREDRKYKSKSKKTNRDITEQFQQLRCNLT